MSKAKNYCLTINNYNEDTIEKLRNFPSISYGIIGKEVAASTGTKHLQCYVQWKHKTRATTVANKIKKLTGHHPHVEVAKGDYKSNHAYCSKEKDFIEFGIAIQQGERTDIAKMYEMVKDGKDDAEIQEECLQTYVKYYKAVDRLRINLNNKKNKEQIEKDFHKDKIELNHWQEEAIDRLVDQNNRQVTWVYDPVGNNGKTFLAKYLIANENTFYIQNGKAADIAHAYQHQEYVVFDFTRSQEEKINYSLIESFKNGILFSPKYESKTKIFKTAKVICFSNFYPELSKLSEDRWDIMEISGMRKNI